MQNVRAEKKAKIKVKIKVTDLFAPLLKIKGH